MSDSPVNPDPGPGLWREEFGADYDVPDAITDDPDIVDVSWHNDVSPSFILATDANRDPYRFRLWVNYPIPSEREFPEQARFCVWDDEDDELVLYEGEDVIEAIRALKSPRSDG